MALALRSRSSNYLRALKVSNAREFAAAAAATKPQTDHKGSGGSSAPSSAYLTPREPLQTTKLDGNVTVSSVDTNKPLAKLAVFFSAGSRYEKSGTEGVAHALRVYAGLGTSGATHFGITRNVEYEGANLIATSGREYIGYVLEATRDKIKSTDTFLREVSSKQAFKPWELQDHLPRLRLERYLRSPEVRTLELLHQASFRRGLGNSMYTPKYMIGKHNHKMLADFVEQNFIEASVVGIGLPHAQVVDFAKTLNINGGNRTVVPSKFYGGGEVRKQRGTELAYVTLAIEGPSFNNPKDFIASALVQRALGSGPRTKRGGTAGKLGNATKDTPLESVAAGFSANYSDVGLLGVFITANPCCVEQVTKKASQILLEGSFSEDELNRAKGALKGDVAMIEECDSSYLEEIGLQTLKYKKVNSTDETFKLIDSVTTSDLNSLVKKGGKLSMASYGNISQVPYLDELK